MERESCPTKKANSLSNYWRAFCARHKAMLCLLVIAFISWPVEEFVAYRFKFDIWTMVSGVWKAVIGGVVLSVITDVLFINPSPRPEGKGIIEHVKQAVKEWIREHVIKNSLLIMLIAAVSFFTPPAYAAHNQWFQKGWHWLTTPREETQLPMTDTQPPTLEEEKEAEQLLETPTEQQPKEPLETTPTPRPSIAYRIVLDDELPEALSEPNRACVNFSEPPYNIIEWKSQENVNDAVRAFVVEYRNLQRNPNYEESHTPESIKNEIEEASNREKVFLGEDSPSIQVLREIIEQRLDIYENDPGYPLARLIRESYCLYGDAYAYQNNDDNAFAFACCLYENSIWWGFECLQYDVSPEDFVENLRYIEERYDKNELITARGSDERLRAERLSNAFRKMALAIEDNMSK